MSVSRTQSPSFDGVAGLYETAARVYSLGLIPASKHAELAHIRSGDRVLYLGVGSGEDALTAAHRGAAVTCLDLSAKMLAKLQKRLDEESLAAELIEGNSLEHQRAEHYDVVTANYFLNCFTREPMVAQLRHAASLVRPGGLLLIADVAPPSGSLLSRGANLAYLKPSMALFCALGLIPWHENYDYSQEFAAAGLSLRQQYDFRLLGLGPAVYRTLVAEKREPTA